MDAKRLVNSLHRFERAVLDVLSKNSGLNEIADASRLKEIEAMRGLQWLENKKLVKQETKEFERVVLGANGREYLKSGLPERRFLEAIEKKRMCISEVKKSAKLSDDEVQVCIGILKRKAAIEIHNAKELEFSITGNGTKLLSGGFLEESFLRRANKGIDVSELRDELKFSFDNLIKRRDIVSVERVKERKFFLTEIGKEISSMELKENFADGLTHKMLADGSWRGKRFRGYDISINVPKIYGGKHHHYRQFLEQARQKFLSMGFSEMFGPIVECDFWNMDALFMPQFHSARDIHDAYYVKKPASMKVDAKLVKKVKDSHEKSWKYKFDSERTHRTLLRTQGTACSARMLASKELKIPGKYFAIAKCFRHDVIDATHLPDFYQMEGIVVDEGLTFKSLKGLLKLFAEEFAESETIKIKPGYFPFTEPSAELFAKHPEMGWVELAGSGIFRKELTKPLGVNVPVIAWGIGIDRLGMFKKGIKDIRQLYGQDLMFLREARV